MNPGTNDHLDLDALADLHAGSEGAGRAHLATCSHCRARLAELEAALPLVTADLSALAALPVPAEPADLDERIAAALAGARRAETGAPTAATVVPLASRARPRSGWLPALSAVAAAAVLVTGGLLVTQRDSGGDADTAAARLYATNATGQDYDQASLAAAVPQLLAGTAATADSRVESGGSVLGGPGTIGGSSGGSGKEAASNAPAPLAADQLAPLRSPSGLAACLAALVDPAEEELPLALDYASYLGKPALVVVLPGGKADKVDVFVVGAGCAQADAHLLYFTRQPRP